jgi:trk system potassium uptake protein TrkH
MFTSLFIIGALFVLFSAIACFPLFFDLLIFQEKIWSDFFIFVTFSFFVGVSLILSSYKTIKNSLESRSAIILTVSLWIIFPVTTSIPFYSFNKSITFVDACFETICAFTTTGSTISALALPKSMLIWLCLLQWFGGVGIIVTAMTFFSALRVGGMQLLQREFSTDHGDKFLPKASVIASSTIVIYSILTLICFFLCWFSKMPLFYAFCHSLSIIPTGGILPFELINTNALKIITSFFMVIGASPLILFVRLWHQEWKAIFRNTQFKGYIFLISAAAILIMVWNYHTKNALSVVDIIFNVASLSSTTGYFSWNWCESFPNAILIVLGLVGGCVGSTAGGLKIFRIQILLILTRVHLLHHSHPHGVYVPTYQHQKIQHDISISVLSFLLIFFSSIVFVITFLSFFNHSINTCFACTIAAITNSTGISYILGWKGSYQDFGAPEKICLMLGMIMGRLEMITPFLFITPSFWKKYKK